VFGREGEVKKLKDSIARGWRAFVVSVFVVAIFAVPSSKGVLGKLFGVSATGNTNKNVNANAKDIKKGQDSGNYSSRSAPSSKPPASPVKPGDSCSTGRMHNVSHGNHHNHDHYTLPNAR
jgi:hypothetical protein